MPTSFGDLPLASVPAAGLADLGWSPDEPEVRDVVPVVARGNHVVAVVPPAPAFAAPPLAGLLSTEAAPSSLTLVLAPEPSLGEWSHLLRALTPSAFGTEQPGSSGTSGLGSLIVRQLEQAAAWLRSEGSAGRLVISTPERCAALFGASAVPSGRVGAIVLAWPELWGEADAAVTAIFQEIPKEAQRVVLTSDLPATAGLVERHAWRAAIVGSGPAAPVPAARTVAVAWSRRVAILPELLAALEADTATVWTADTSRHEEIRGALAGSGIASAMSRGSSPPPPAAQVVAFDPPPALHLPRLAAAGSLTLLVPPGTEHWVRAAVRVRQPLVLPQDPAGAAGHTARRRRAIAAALEAGALEEGLLALGPLFERYEPTLVAAALYRLWQGAEAEATAPPPPLPATERIWVNAGRRDEVGPHDLVGLLVNELDVRREAIGRIELRDTFSLVELPAAEAERIAEALTGRTLRRRRLVARVDRQKRQRATQRGGPF